MNQSLKNYIKLIRINKPTGVGLLFLPCVFGSFLAEKTSALNSIEIWQIIFLFAIGSLLMRSAGCIINDIFDQKFDQQVARTKNRPLANGDVSPFEALIILAFLLSMALLVLLKFNFLTIIAGFLALILVILYPLMKRVTYYPQIFLGLTFNFGILMSSLAINKTIKPSTVILYLAAIIWTLIYDTIYAYQDIEDDLKIGVKSSAIKFKKNPFYILSSLNFIMFSILFLVGFLESLNWKFYLINCLAFLFLEKKIASCDFKNDKSCLEAFKVNFWIGFLISIAIFVG